jgi:hypothetical protein
VLIVIDGVMQLHAEGDAVNAWVYDIERITTWFETEAGDLRFPSRVEIRRINYELERGKNGWRIRPEPVLQVDQSYRRYEFFGVSTKEKQGWVVEEEP